MARHPAPLNLFLVAALAAAAALAACGGNFSNEDLEYLNALPSREALASSSRKDSIQPVWMEPLRREISVAHSP